jgi:hypothetical protein
MFWIIHVLYEHQEETAKKLSRKKKYLTSEVEKFWKDSLN